ncbi:MAG: DUF4388 domain-containing protein [Acidobacteriota bacterium]|jgi:hypothetical protein
MSLSGTLDTMSLPDLLQWLHTAQKTGTLSVRGPAYTKRIFFRSGDIVSSASEDPTEHLGQFLLSHGAITEEDLKRGMEVQADTGVLLGKILIMVGTLGEEDLKRYLVLKAEETIFSLFLWDNAHFEFRAGEIASENLVPITVKIDDVLLKGLGRYDELQQIKRVFGTMLTVVGRAESAPGPEFLANGRRRAIWECIDGNRSIIDIAMELHMAEFVACEVIHLLYQMRHVVILKHVQARVEGGTVSPPSYEDPLLEGRRLAAEGAYEEALDLVQRAAVEDREGTPALRSLLKEIQDAFVDRTYRYHLPGERVPYLRKPLEQLTSERLSPQEGFLISRINGEWKIRDIVTIAPFSEVDALRTLKSLRRREIIELR